MTEADEVRKRVYQAGWSLLGLIVEGPDHPPLPPDDLLTRAREITDRLHLDRPTGQEAEGWTT